MNRIVLSTALLFLAASVSQAGNWPGWRGPRGDGTVLNAPKLTTELSPTSGTVWKTAIPGTGHASPIIWEDHIFLVSAREEGDTRSLICLDRESGEILWNKVVLASPFEGIHRLNSRASSTPATDGKSVYVSFLDEEEMFIAAYDFDGNVLWEKRPGGFSSKHGYCSCPVLWKDLVIVNGDHDGDAYIVALDAKTGETKWKTDRPNKTRSYSTPIIRNIKGRNQLMLSGSLSVASYDPDTGKQQWILDGPTEQYVASLIYNPERNLLFLTCGFPEKHLMAIRPDGNGNITDTHVQWHETAGASYVPSPIGIGDYFLVVADNGVASCFDALSGNRYWRERLVSGKQEPGHSASLISANGLAYFFSDMGVMTVVKPGRELEIVAQTELGEELYASPAVFENDLYLRGAKHLFRFKGK
ncbi:PQQ-binding-like beta-propeller repeat protein [Verrucomicrobiales bacterium BCK34]|nr:PQQ-binding-like beta-propeller repeat protein [Verrucomicrobiales bacterium BCK34]